MARYVKVTALAAALIGAAGLASAQCWIARWSGPDIDMATEIALDSAGNVHVSGSSCYTVYNSDIVTVKYDPDGNEQWVARYDYERDDDQANDIATDRHGNVYITGLSCVYSPSYYAPDYVTIKYRPDGEQAWVARYNARPGELDTDVANALALDSLGNVYVTGRSRGDFATVKYDSNGTQLWAARYNHGGGQYIARDVCVDGHGNVYVTGSWGLTVKYDSLGNERWVAFDREADLKAVAVDKAGNVYAFGSRVGANWGDYSLTKYDSLGHKLWLAAYDGTAGSDDKGVAMALDDRANIYVGGHSEGAGTGRNFCTIKYDSAGNELWVARHDSGGGCDWLNGLAINDKNVCVTGSKGNNGFCTVVYDTEGRECWEAYHRGQVGYGYGAAVAFDVNGYVHATGTITFDTLLGGDYFTIKYDMHGVPVWEPGTRTPTPAPACPSHVRGLLHLAGNQPGRLLDITGRQVLALHPGDNDVRRLAAGVYLVVRLDADGFTASQKLVVQR